MRRAVRVGAVLVLALAIPLPSEAFDGTGCGGEHRGTADCRFLFKGSPIIYRGDAIADGQAAVRVWVTVDGYPEVVLLSCEASGEAVATCDDGFPDQTTIQDLPEQVPRIALRCWVEGVAEGQYFCQSGTG